MLKEMFNFINYVGSDILLNMDLVTEISLIFIERGD
tara:strand:+ start:220 stop:327 length:108 start_codon:yes stop_codon:yes gene_type:complete